MSSKISKGVDLDHLTEKYSKSRYLYNKNLSIGDKVWMDVKYDYSIDYKPNKTYHLEKNFGDEYNTHNTKETILDTPYYDSKENDEFYSMNKFQRVKFLMKKQIEKMVSFYKNFLLYIFTYFLFMFNLAKRHSKERLT